MSPLSMKLRPLDALMPTDGRRCRHFEKQIVHSTPALNTGTMPRGRPRKLRVKSNEETDPNKGESDGELKDKKCTTCTQTFSTESQLQKHLREHESDKPHRCDECPQSFNLEFNLTLHKSTHSTSDFSCPVCHKKFSRIASLKSHLMLHEKEENLMCAECGDEFVLQSQLSLHLEEHRKELSGAKVFTCKTCNAELKTSTLLKEHMKTHVKMRPLLSSTRNYKKSIDRSGFTNSCLHCGKTFKKPSQLVRHIRIHTGERPFKCSHCGKAFNQKAVLQTHMVKHTGEKPHLCMFCPASFSQKGNLHCHVQRVHSEAKGGMFPCMDCSCVFKKLGSLNAHISKMHISVIEVPSSASETETSGQAPGGPEGGEGVTDVIQQLLELSEQVSGETSQPPPPEPSIPIESAINQDILQQALENSGLSVVQPEDNTTPRPIENIHNNSSSNNTHTPTVSNKKVLERIREKKRSIFKKPIQMPGSIREENGVRWHGCPYCTKEFKKPSDLVRHIRIHTHEKPFKCKQCYRAFAVKSTLTAHMKTHTGIKAFECQSCLKCFSTSGSMKVHMRLHTGVRPFSCPHCDKIFRTSGHRKTHIASHFKNAQQKKHKFPRKANKTKVPKTNVPLPDIPLQEPILITDFGLILSQNRLAFQQYLDVVTTDRPFKCQFCNKAYKKSSHLKQHVRSHTGERPYKCVQCSRGFSSSGVLKAHIRTHSGLKAYKCLMCDTTFTTSGSLRRHMTTHSDLRPYMCPYCQKTFKSSPNCRKHMKTHRYELAQQLQNQSADDPLGATTDIQVEISDGSLQPASTTTPEQQSMLGLDQTEVVNGDQQVTLETTLADQPLVQGEDSYVSTQHALPQNISQFETPALPQPSFDQQSLTQGFTISDPSYNQNQFSTVQQLQDSSTLESQALSTSYPPPNLLVSSDEVTHNDLLQNSQDELQLTAEAQDYQDDSEDNSKRVHRCNWCKKGFKKSSHLKQHVRSHTGEKPFRCHLCERSFVSAGVLKAHLNTHTGVKPFKCDVCEATFTTNGSLSRHMITHMKSYKCSICGDSFRTSLMCKKHLKKEHSIETGIESHPEDEDDEDDDEDGEPKASKRRCMGIITFTEEQTAELAKDPGEDASVSERILAQSAAERDRISEIKDKAVELETEPKFANCCNYCPKSFKKPSDLVRHIRIHTGERPYKCDECGKSFTVKSTLDSHVKTHTGQKLFSCHMCNTSFSTKGSLKVHMRLHTGSKPFKCPFCELRFRTSGHRKTHIQCHFRPNSERKSKRSASAHSQSSQDTSTSQTVVSGEGQTTGASDLQSVGLLQTPNNDSNIYLQTSLTGLDQNLLQPGLVGQAILPASMSAAGDLTVSLSDGLTTLEGIQLQLTPANLVCPNVQISGIDASNINNITLQIDPTLLQQTLQQTLQQGGLLSQPLSVDSGLVSHSGNQLLSSTDPTSSASVVLHPLTSLPLQPPTITPAQVTMAGLSDHDTAGSQDLSHVMGSSGLVSGSNSSQEITFTFNNSSLSQAIAQVQAQASATGAGSATGGTQEITLTISGQDLLPQHNNSAGAEINGSIRLASPLTSQSTNATLTITNDHLLPPSPANTGLAVTSLPASSALSHSAASQSLVMSPATVASDGSVTLTLADAQGMLDGVTLNLNAQGQSFPVLNDSALQGQATASGQQVILIAEETHKGLKDVSSEADSRNQCFYCNQMFPNANSLRRHCKQAHGKDRCHVCPVCNKAFKRATHLKEHERVHQPGPSPSSQKPRVFNCSSCSKAFAKRSQLERHNRTHTGERPFKCPQCDKAFNQKSALQVHMVKHTGKKPFKCEVCSIRFTQKSNMKHHMKRAHGYGQIQDVSLGQDDTAPPQVEVGPELDLEVVPESSGDWHNVFS